VPAGTEVHDAIAQRYRRFARLEAPGRSPLYVEVSERIADDAAILAFLGGLPAPKRQPNLLFAAVRYLYGTPASAAAFVECIRTHATEIERLMRRRSTQTNEPARCATLLPALARLPQPLALIEVGASAGLCLLPDRYAYAYPGAHVPAGAPVLDPPPTFACRADDATPIPERNVVVAWRAGLDLAPVDLRDPAEVRWLEALVWPGEEYRLPGLARARAAALADPPRIVRGDLRTDLAALVQQAPRYATLVVFHTAVLAYVDDPGERAAFAESVADAGATWIANESPERIPGVDLATLPERPDPDAFALAVNGEPVAWTDGHGAWVQWLTPAL
jgi:hypothetical protein